VEKALTSQESLGRIDRQARAEPRLTVVRVLLPLGWMAAAVGYFGPWIAHPTAALTLSGVDMGEFVKFLPQVLDGSIAVTRQFLYLPPFAVVVSMALLIGSRDLRYPWPFRVLGLLAALPISVQVLPPAWSVDSLLSAEFRLQTTALGICWLLLAGFWLLGRLSPLLTGSFIALLSLGALALSLWQYLLVKPAADQVYGAAPGIGWGLLACILGLAVMALAAAILAVQTRRRSGGMWTG
jgi:hypothetical protein